MSRKRARSVGSLFSQAALHGCVGTILLFATVWAVIGGMVGYNVGYSLWGLAGGILGAVIGPIVFLGAATIIGLGEKLDD